MLRRYNKLLKEGEVYILEHPEVHTECSNKTGKTMLHIAALHGDVEVVKMLLCHGSNVNSQTSPTEGIALNTPLHSAAEGGNPNVIKELLAHGANIFLRNEEGRTAFFYAVWYGNKEVIHILLQYNLDIINEQDKTGYTPLHYAIKKGNKEIILILLQKGAHVNIQDRFGCTPLREVSWDRIDIAKILLNYGADYTILDHEGKDGLYGFSEKDKQKLLLLTTLNSKEPEEQ